MYGLEICKPCLDEESGDSGTSGIVPGNVYTITEPRACTSMRHTDLPNQADDHWTCDSGDHVCRDNDIVCGCRCDGCADDGEPRCDRCNVLMVRFEIAPGVYLATDGEDHGCPDCRPDALIDDEDNDDGED